MPTKNPPRTQNDIKYEALDLLGALRLRFSKIHAVAQAHNALDIRQSAWREELVYVIAELAQQGESEGDRLEAHECFRLAAAADIPREALAETGGRHV